MSNFNKIFSVLCTTWNSTFIVLQKWLSKYVIEEKIGEKMTVRRGRRRKQLLDDLELKRGYGKFKEEVLDRTLWITRLGRGYRPVVRQNRIMISGLTCE